jgi:hypothetical protein
MKIKFGRKSADSGPLEMSEWRTDYDAIEI